MRGSTPCTEGTGSFCRVPSRGFSRTPSDARLAHLCRIAVRAARFVLARLFAATMPLDFQIECCRPCGTGASITPIQVLAASPVGSPFLHGWRNINRLSIGYALGPRLRSRLTLGGLTFPRKPCAFGGRASHPSCRYSFRHAHSARLHGSLPVPLRCAGRRSPTTRRVLSAECGSAESPPAFAGASLSTQYPVLSTLLGPRLRHDA